MDGIILIILLLVVCFYFRDICKIVYAVAIVDIFLRIFHFIINNIEIKGISKYVEKYLPESIPSIIETHTSGLICNILVWMYVIIMGVFLFYTIKKFIKSK